MQKIEKCNGHNCDIKENCYRYTTRHTSEYVVTFVYNKKEQSCDEFIPNKFINNF